MPERDSFAKSNPWLKLFSRCRDWRLWKLETLFHANGEHKPLTINLLFYR